MNCTENAYWLNRIAIEEATNAITMIQNLSIYALLQIQIICETIAAAIISEITIKALAIDEILLIKITIINAINEEEEAVVEAIINKIIIRINVEVV